MTDVQPIQSQPDDEAGNALRRTLRRCPGYTYDAVIEYRRTQSLDCLPTVAAGILARYATPGAREKLRPADPQLRLVEDLGLDSLDRLQAVMLLEEVLQLKIDDRALADMRTFGDVVRVLRELAAGAVTVQPQALLVKRNAMA